MVLFNWILPRHGGGWARRYFAFRKEIYQRSWETKDLYPCLPISLFDYTRPHDAADAARVQQKDQDAWRISDDRVIGGFSVSHANFFRTRQEYNAYMRREKERMDGMTTEEADNGSEEEAAAAATARTIAAASKEEPDDDKNHKNTTAETMIDNMDNDFTPFLRWQGTLSTTIGLQSNVQRSGFVALRSPEFPWNGANLQGMYNALELTCRPDKNRIYTVNLKVASSIPHDIYQKQIIRRSEKRNHAASADDADADAAGEENQFDRFVLPFSSFRLTSRGREREVFRELDDNICIESIGIALMDGQDGDFTFDLCRIRAVNVHEDYGVFDKIPG